MDHGDNGTIHDANVDDSDAELDGKAGDEGNTFFNKVNPTYRQLCRILERNYTDSNVERLISVMDELILERNEQVMASASGSSLEGMEWVSSEAATEPNRFERRHLGKRSSGYL